MSKIEFKAASKPGHPKYLQLIDSVMNSIQNGELRARESLPSVNQIMHENKLSRDTVVKAYNELKKRGVIDSVPNKGYFIREDSEKIFLFSRAGTYVVQIGDFTKREDAVALKDRLKAKNITNCFIPPKN